MDKFIKLDITNLTAIIQKQENEKFYFFNPQRLWDGFILITSGVGFATNSNGEQHTVQKGDMLLLRKNDRYKLSFPDGCSYITSAYDLSIDGNGDFFTKLPFIIKCTDKQIQVINKICDIWQAREWDSYTECRIQLLKFYLDIVKLLYRSSDTDKDISRAINYIHENFKKNFSGKELSDVCALSLSYLRTKFLRQTGYTILAYRDNLRISAAKEMLESGYFSVSEIAIDLGYCDVYHFSKAFKKQTNMSPTAYIKKRKGL